MYGSSARLKIKIDPRPVDPSVVILFFFFLVSKVFYKREDQPIKREKAKDLRQRGYNARLTWWELSDLPIN